MQDQSKFCLVIPAGYTRNIKIVEQNTALILLNTVIRCNSVYQNIIMNTFIDGQMEETTTLS